jgi:hypothetical protein
LATACQLPDESGSLKNLRQYWPGDDIIQLAVRLGLLALLVYWTFLLIRPFVPILAWSIVLAVALLLGTNYLYPRKTNQILSASPAR